MEFRIKFGNNSTINISFNDFSINYRIIAVFGKCRYRQSNPTTVNLCSKPAIQRNDLRHEGEKNGDNSLYFCSF